MNVPVVTFAELNAFIDRYGKTQRVCYLQPEMLVYTAKNGSPMRPLDETTFNDDGPVPTGAKRAYYTSPTFAALPLQEQLRQIEILGLSGSLYHELYKKPWFRKILLKREMLLNKSDKTRGESI